MPHEFYPYVDLHFTILDTYERQNWIAYHTIDVVATGGPSFFIAGEIALPGNMVLSVQKLIAYLPDDGSGRVLVDPCKYSYNASIRGHHSILRYDNHHPDYLHDGHRDEFHVHRFNWMTGDNLNGSPEWIGRSNWPRLGDVLDELRVWHSDNHVASPCTTHLRTILYFCSGVSH